MRNPKRDMVWVFSLAALCAGIAWHVVSWNSSGMYLELLDRANGGEVYLPVLYNLGLITAAAVALGLFITKLTDLLGHIRRQAQFTAGKKGGDAAR